MTFEQELEAIERLQVFDDSEEIAIGVWGAANTYWNKEAATHIEGLWQTANDLARIVSKYHEAKNDTH